MNERTGIGELKGIGEKTEKLFHRLGVYTVGDLLRHYPRGYDIRKAESRQYPVYYPELFRYHRIAKCRLQL